MKRLLLVSLLFIPLQFLMGARMLVVGGHNVGIEMRTDGLIVTGTYDVKHPGGIYNPATSDIKKGDKIKAVNEKEIYTIDAFTNLLAESKSDQVKLTLSRNGGEIIRVLRIYPNAQNSYRTGLFVKEKVVGVGTVTYFDKQNNTYGALGHQINDSDSGRIFDLSFGTLYESNVLTVKKSQVGDPGEKVAQINNSKSIGDVQKNTEFGVFGKNSSAISGQELEIATANEVQVGPAKILTVLQGSNIESFEIAIVDLKKQSVSEIKGITVKVTDARLLEKTNGIIQGMSGSPIVQNGKIVGAITHVLIDRPNFGYGIYIEHMLAQSDQL